MKNLIFIFLISVNVLSQTYNPNLINVTVSAERDTFLIDEPIYIEFKQTNVGQNKISTKHFVDQFVDYYSESFIGPDGDKLDRIIQSHFDTFSSKAEGYYLEPKQSQYFVFDITFPFGYIDDRIEPSWRKYYLKPGKYTYQITLYSNSNYLYEYNQSLLELKVNNIEDREKVLNTIDRMPVKSNVLTFYIVEPDSGQNVERLAMINLMKINWIDNQLEFINQTEKYLSAYKNSDNLYKYFVYDRIRLLREPPINIEVILSINNLFSECKNSYYSYKMIEYGKELYKDLKSDNRRYTPIIEGYYRIANNYPNSRLAIYANSAARDKEIFREKFLKSGKTE